LQIRNKLTEEKDKKLQKINKTHKKRKKIEKTRNIAKKIEEKFQKKDANLEIEKKDQSRCFVNIKEKKIENFQDKVIKEKQENSKEENLPKNNAGENNISDDWLSYSSHSSLCDSCQRRLFNSQKTSKKMLK